MSNGLSHNLRWSLEMNRVFNAEVNAKVLGHQLSRPDENIFFGFPYDTLRNDVIEMGLADFAAEYTDEEYGTLTQEQVVLCYCFINMKQHFFSALANFRIDQHWIDDLITETRQVFFIDIGCGPATAGLAFAEAFKSLSFHYVGVDRSLAMLDQARGMLIAARREQLGKARPQPTFVQHWDEILLELATRDFVIVNFSYFFGSQFIDATVLRSLRRFCRELFRSVGTSQVLISYTNSVHTLANDNYRSFVEGLGIDFEASPPTQCSFSYYPNPTASTPTSRKSFLREIYEVVYS